MSIQLFLALRGAHVCYVHKQKPDDGHSRALSQTHLQFESCNPIGESIELVPSEKRFQRDCREQKRNT